MTEELEASDVVRARMSNQARRDTFPEMELRRALHARGLRFRLGWRVPGRPRRTMDIAFPGLLVGVFVDGCFWHSCPEHATHPQNNALWWDDKLRRNVERDRDTDVAMKSAGWSVVRVWEHENPESAAEEIVDILVRRRVEKATVGPPA